MARAGAAIERYSSLFLGGEEGMWAVRWVVWGCGWRGGGGGRCVLGAVWVVWVAGTERSR